MTQGEEKGEYLVSVANRERAIRGVKDDLDNDGDRR